MDNNDLFLVSSKFMIVSLLIANLYASKADSICLPSQMRFHVQLKEKNLFSMFYCVSVKVIGHKV